MAHLSETTKRLDQYIIEGNIKDVICLDNNVSFINLPFYSCLDEIPQKNELYNSLNNFIKQSHDQATIAILCSPVLAADYCSQIDGKINFRHWIAIKSKKSFRVESYIQQNHVTLLIFTKYSGPLKFIKTRIAYSYCPSCNKTTKDYGGKKHLYHEFGTAISDVWRDVSVDVDNYPDVIIDRLRDLFGVGPYTRINILDQRIFYKALPPNKAVYKKGKQQPNRLKSNIFKKSLLINDDCLNALTKIPDNSIDFCFADPPYNLDKKYENWDDDKDIHEYFEWCDTWMTEIIRILKPGRTLAVLNIPQWSMRHFQFLIKNLQFLDWIAWDALSLPTHLILPSHYSIQCFSKGKPRTSPGLEHLKKNKHESVYLKTIKEMYCNRKSCLRERTEKGIVDTEVITNLWWDIHRLKHNSRRVDHACQLPPKIMYRLISLFTKEQEIVLDPFNGTGTTSLAAHQLQRMYIGIELSNYYHKIAFDRHEELDNDIDPFRKTSIIPNSKNNGVERQGKQKYQISKKALQLEIKRISKELKHTPTRLEVAKLSKYPTDYFDSYFRNWSEACAAVRTTGMKEHRK